MTWVQAARLSHSVELKQGSPHMGRMPKIILVSAMGITLAGCATPSTMSHTGAGAVGGTAIGAATGAIIGHHSGHAGGGALIGAAAGALGGALLGNAEDAREERNAAIAQAQYSRAQTQYAQAQSRAMAQALTSSDVVNMTRNGVGDDTIINSLHARGCRFDSTPDNIISLRQQGVSDRVLTAMTNTGLKAPAAATPVVVTPPPVVYAPPPVVAPEVVVVGPRRCWGPPPRRYWRAGFHGHW